MVQYPAATPGKIAAFYQEVFGFTEKFRDGDRYVALQAGGVTMGIANKTESLELTGPHAAIKVNDVEAFIAKAVAAGGKVLTAPQEGPHEIRAALADPDGNPFVIYSPR